jgi:hypothetical protein
MSEQPLEFQSVKLLMSDKCGGEWIQHGGHAYCKFCQFCFMNGGDVASNPAKCPKCRDQFAMAALTGILASQPWQDSPYNHDEIAVLALDQADAMMVARSRVPDAS